MTVPMEIEMPRHKTYVPHGVIPAVILPFHDDLSIDEPNFRKHLRDVTAVDGLSAVTVHDGPKRRDGSRALQAHRRRLRPAADRIPVSARDRPGLSERNHSADDRGHSDAQGHQGL